MFKKILLNSRLFVDSLFRGLKQADVVLTSQGDVSKNKPLSEQQNEQNSLWNDLLRGEETQRVKELRHEMYLADRKSHHYAYKDGKTENVSMFDYNGKYENSDNHRVLIVQDNYQELDGLTESIGNAILNVNDDKRYVLHIERDFIPSFKIEEYASKLIVKDYSVDKAVLDIYTSLYPLQFNKRHRFFINELERVYNGDVKSSLIDIKTLSFISYKAFGVDDLHQFIFDDIKYQTTLKYEGSYVVRFIAHKKKYAYDLITPYFDKSTQGKIDRKEMRDNAILDFSAYANNEKNSSTVCHTIHKQNPNSTKTNT